jgi:hypothetical protein
VAKGEGLLCKQEANFKSQQDQTEKKIIIKEIA